MVVLDATIVNIAMPSAQADLGFSDNDRQWVVTAYALAFGSLLLLGGRLADMFGRRRMFLIGLVGFAVASALGGAAQSFELLVGARALQGAFAAVLAPAALSVLTTTFTQPKERARAFGVFGAIAGMGGAIGLMLGGYLTENFNWRWNLYVNVFIAAIAFVAGTHAAVQDRRAAPQPRSTCRASCSPRAACSCSSSGSRRPSPRAGPRRRSGARSPSAWSCSSASCCVSAPRSSRCCRCRSSRTATAAPRSSRSSSPGRACSACSCSSPTTCS